MCIGIFHIIQPDFQNVDFYGRTGYAPTRGTYTWNEAGLLNSDSSRGILSTTYNHLGLPARQSIKTNSSMAMTVFYSYSADGTLLSVGSGTTRYYSGSRIFEGNALEYSYFPGGYFDAAGAAHYTHTDYQGSIIAVTDSTGKVVQKVDYYPYGEPFREPAGQPMLFSGKERTTLADYRFNPRSYNPAGIFWHAPDLKAHEFTSYSLYSYCFGNPILLIDRNGLEPSLYEAALMSLCAYQETSSDEYREAINILKNRNWGVSNKQTGIKYNDTGLFGNGFQSLLFEKKKGDEVAEYAYAIAGTSNIKDALQDGLQLVGASSQYYMAVNNTESLMNDKDISQKGLTTVGHSLGGGCAAAASMATGCSAITFNAAAVSGFTNLFLGLKDNDKITNAVSASKKILGISVIVDPLTVIQDLKRMPAQGQRIYLPINFSRLHSIHSINTVIDALKR